MYLGYYVLLLRCVPEPPQSKPRSLSPPLSFKFTLCWIFHGHQRLFCFALPELRTQSICHVSRPIRFHLRDIHKFFRPHNRPCSRFLFYSLICCFSFLFLRDYAAECFLFATLLHHFQSTLHKPQRVHWHLPFSSFPLRMHLIAGSEQMGISWANQLKKCAQAPARRENWWRRFCATRIIRWRNQENLDGSLARNCPAYYGTTYLITLFSRDILCVASSGGIKV